MITKRKCKKNAESSFNFRMFINIKANTMNIQCISILAEIRIRILLLLWHVVVHLVWINNRGTKTCFELTVTFGSCLGICTLYILQVIKALMVRN